MKTQSKTLALFSLVGFGLIPFLGLTRGLRAQEMVRAAVKTKVPLTHSIVDQLAQYGQVKHVLWRINIVDMQVAKPNADSLLAHPLVQYVEPDGETLSPLTEQVTSVPDFSDGVSPWNLDIIQVTDSDQNPVTQCLGTDNMGTGSIRCVDETGEGVYVAVLDTGLTPNWQDFFPPERIAADLGRTFVDGLPPDQWDQDPCGHGTGVLSVILGYYTPPFLPFPFVNGVAPKVKAIPVRGLGLGPNCVGSTLDLTNAIYYVAGLPEVLHAPVVMNNSWGGLFPSQSILDALHFAMDKGVIVIAAAGNCGPHPIGFCLGEAMGWPGADPKVISVAATGWVRNWTINGEPDFTGFWTIENVPEFRPPESYIASYSSRENENFVPGFDQELDIAAPANWIFAPVGSFYTFVLGGTSAAAPHVSGAAALLMQKDPSLTQADVEDILKSTALPIAPGKSYNDPFFPSAAWGIHDAGAGLLQVNRALEKVKER